MAKARNFLKLLQKNTLEDAKNFLQQVQRLQYGVQNLIGQGEVDFNLDSMMENLIAQTRARADLSTLLTNRQSLKRLNESFHDHELGALLIEILYNKFFIDTPNNDADFSFLFLLLRQFELCGWEWAKFWGDAFGDQHESMFETLLQRSIELDWPETFLEVVSFLFPHCRSVPLEVKKRKTWPFMRKVKLFKTVWYGAQKFNLTTNPFVLDRMITILNFFTPRELSNKSLFKGKICRFYRGVGRALAEDQAHNADIDAGTKWNREMVQEYIMKYILRRETNFECRCIIWEYPQENMKEVNRRFRKSRTENIGCNYCGKEIWDGLNACAGCGVGKYCNLECQKRDWDKHKKSCKKLEKLQKKIYKTIPSFLNRLSGFRISTV